MERHEFMRKLKSALRWQLDGGELRKVLREYEQYFIRAEAEGKGAAEVSAELGEPSLVAIEILSEHAIDITGIKYNKARVIAAVVLLAVSTIVYVINPIVWQLILPSDNGKYISLSMIFRQLYLLLLLPTALALLLALGKSERLDPPPASGLLWINLVSTGSIWAIWYFTFYLPIIAIVSAPNTSKVDWLWWSIPTRQIGPAMALLTKVLSLVAVAFIVAMALRIRRGHLICIPLLYLNCSTICGMYEYTMMLRSMTSPAILPIMIMDITVHVALGILLSALVAVLIMMRRRRRGV